MKGAGDAELFARAREEPSKREVQKNLFKIALGVPNPWPRRRNSWSHCGLRVRRICHRRERRRLVEDFGLSIEGVPTMTATQGELRVVHLCQEEMGGEGQRGAGP